MRTTNKKISLKAMYLAPAIASGINDSIRRRGVGFFNREDFAGFGKIPVEMLSDRALTKLMPNIRKYLDENHNISSARCNGRVQGLSVAEAVKLTKESAHRYVIHGGTAGMALWLFVCNGCNVKRDGAIIVAAEELQLRRVFGDPHIPAEESNAGGQIKAIVGRLQRSVDNSVFDSVERTGDLIAISKQISKRSRVLSGQLTLALGLVPERPSLEAEVEKKALAA